MFVKNVCDYPYAFVHNGQKIIIPNDNRIYIIPDDVDVNLIRGFLAYKTEHKHIDVDVSVLKVSIDIDEPKIEPEIINKIEEPVVDVVQTEIAEPEIINKIDDEPIEKPVVVQKTKPTKNKKIVTKSVDKSSVKK